MERLSKITMSDMRNQKSSRLCNMAARMAARQPANAMKSTTKMAEGQPPWGLAMVAAKRRGCCKKETACAA
jgi:hypothetical protein